MNELIDSVKPFMVLVFSIMSAISIGFSVYMAIRKISNDNRTDTEHNIQFIADVLSELKVYRNDLDTFGGTMEGFKETQSRQTEILADMTKLLSLTREELSELRGEFRQSRSSQ